MISEEDLAKELKKAKLLYISDKRPGIMRQKIGRGFTYYTSDGKRVTANKIISRIAHLVIPPAWENVWICPRANGYLQATGYDDRGRKQYLYHEAWVELCQQNKFDKLSFFGKMLPRIRRHVRADMRIRGLTKKKVVATVVWLLEHTLIRVGNDEYAKENQSFGLTTLRSRHVSVHDDSITFDFVGKSGVPNSVDISNPLVRKIIKKCIELPGYEIFKYVDEKGQKHTIDSEDVNNYLREITGEDITAKDFRTWGATLLSAVTLEKLGEAKDKNQLKRNLNKAIKFVSEHLNNTPKVCRSYYIHPAIFKSYETKKLFSTFQKKVHKPADLSMEESTVLALLG